MSEPRPTYDVSDRSQEEIQAEILERLGSIKNIRANSEDLRTQIDALTQNSEDFTKVEYLRGLVKEQKAAEDVQRQAIEELSASFYRKTGVKIKLEGAELKISNQCSVIDQEGAFRWAVENKKSSFLVLDESKLIEFAKAVREMKEEFAPIAPFVKFEEVPFISLAKKL